MPELDFLKLRDGSEHQVGPLSLQFTGPGETGPEGMCSIKTEHASFDLNWMNAEAIAFCIEPSAQLWKAFDSDREEQAGTRQERGWLRLVIISDRQRLGGLTEWTGKAFQVGRLVLNAKKGERVQHPKAAGPPTIAAKHLLRPMGLPSLKRVRCS